MKTICFSSIKGGTGKTSICALTANLLASLGYRVLVLDLDIQNSLTFYYLDDFDLAEDCNIAKALQEDNLSGNIIPSIRNRVFICPSHLNLLKLRAINGRTLIRILPQVEKEYDYCLIDCAPTFDNIVLNALNAADVIVTPARLAYFDYKSLLFLREQIGLETDGNKDWRVLVNFYRAPRSSSPDTVAAQYLRLFQETFDNVLGAKIPESALIQRAIDTREVVSEAKTKQRVYRAFIELVGNITSEPVTQGVVF